MTRGGDRPGAGRKPSGKRAIQFWVTQSEADYLQKALADFREQKQPEDRTVNMELKNNCYR